MPKSIKLQWKGQEYLISEREVFEVAGEIEEVVTIGELAEMAKRPKFVKLSRAYAVMLKFAGAKNVTAQDIHSEIMGAIKGKSADDTKLVLFSAIESLMTILMDGAPEADGDDKGKGTAGAS
jgi:hypothetical protein